MHSLIEFEPAPEQPGLRAHKRFVDAFDRGLRVRAAGDTIALAPPLIIERAEIDELIGTMTSVLRSAN
jgi:beta-alanine--pyruvate transaminase